MKSLSLLSISPVPKFWRESGFSELSNFSSSDDEDVSNSGEERSTNTKIKSNSRLSRKEEIFEPRGEVEPVPKSDWRDQNSISSEGELFFETAERLFDSSLDGNELEPSVSHEYLATVLNDGEEDEIAFPIDRYNARAKDFYRIQFDPSTPISPTTDNVHENDDHAKMFYRLDFTPISSDDDAQEEYPSSPEVQLRPKRRPDLKRSFNYPDLSRLGSPTDPVLRQSTSESERSSRDTDLLEVTKPKFDLDEDDLEMTKDMEELQASLRAIRDCSVSSTPLRKMATLTDLTLSSRKDDNSNPVSMSVTLSDLSGFLDKTPRPGQKKLTDLRGLTPRARGRELESLGCDLEVQLSRNSVRFSKRKIKRTLNDLDETKGQDSFTKEYLTDKNANTPRTELFKRLKRRISKVGINGIVALSKLVD